MAEVDEVDRHEFEPIMICTECGAAEEDCECDDPYVEEVDECAVCGDGADEEQHEEDE